MHARHLVLDRHIATQADAADRLPPVDTLYQGLDFIAGSPRGKRRTHQCTHAGARDAIDRHIQFIQYLEHANV